jgi:hypothetical protein
VAKIDRELLSESGVKDAKKNESLEDIYRAADLSRKTPQDNYFSVMA